MMVFSDRWAASRGNHITARAGPAGVGVPNEPTAQERVVMLPELDALAPLYYWLAGAHDAQPLVPADGQRRFWLLPNSNLVWPLRRRLIGRCGSMAGVGHGTFRGTKSVASRDQANAKNFALVASAPYSALSIGDEG